MAAAGCSEDNSSMDNEDKAEDGSLIRTEIIKKNGVSQSLLTSSAAEAKSTKVKKVVRINGAGKFSISPPSVPALRSRRDPFVSDLGKKTKKLTAPENKDGHFYEKLGKSGCRPESIKTNPTEDTNESPKNCQSEIKVPSKKPIFECSSKLQNGTLKRNSHCTPTSNCSNCDDKHSISVKTESFKNESETLKTEKACVKPESLSVKSEISTENKVCKTEIDNIKKTVLPNGMVSSPLILTNGTECKVNTRVPCHNSNGIHFVFRLQSPTINNTSVSNLWRTNGSEFNTPDTSRSSTPQPLFGGCSIFSPGADVCKSAEKVEEKPALTECKWTKCGVNLDPAGLMDHIKQSHVETQTGKETFVCLWENCKVYNKTSCSQSWLNRHILCHSGDKPFRCIVEGCDLRFPSQNALERHVNNHFNTLPPPNARTVRSRDDTPTKICRKKRLKRKRPGQVKTGDFFDCGVMDCIRQDMVKLAKKTQLDIKSGSNNSVTFQTTVIGRRTDKSGKTQVLVHYTPEDVLPDRWLLESQVDKSGVQTIPLSTLPPDSAISLNPSIYRTHRFRKHRRK